MLSRSRSHALRNALAAAVLSLACASGAHATVFRFDTDPFAGTAALATPGRQIIGNELFIQHFSFSDTIELDSHVFGTNAPLTIFNGLAQDIPNNADLVVLRTLDADPATPGNQLNAGTAANLIAAEIHDSHPGFFIYFNSALDLPRLVFSTDLSSTTADLKVLARFVDQGGPTGPDNLARFGPQIAGVPEAATWSLMITGFGFAGSVLRQARRRSIA